jgi:hypothetical protein
MAYIILVENDGTLYGSYKTKIMQREKLFNKLWFLVPPHYNGHDMSQCTVTMRYLLPISREFVTETLALSDEKYKEYLKYVLPVDTNLTKECGDIELNLTFIMLDVDDEGNVVQRVRKTDNYKLHITQLPNWDSVIPDQSLAAIDQRIIAQTAQIKSLNNLAEILSDTKVDNLSYDEKSDSLQLMAGDKVVGNRVSVKDMIDDGIPVVDLDSDNDAGSNIKPEDGCGCGCEHEDNVIEFGDLDFAEKPIEDDNVVEF